MKTLKERFDSKVLECPTSGCWLWDGATLKNGYGYFYNGERMEMAHRVSYKIYCGEIPYKYEIDHVCRNRGCVNPVHLRIATGSQNKANKPIGNTNSSGFLGVTYARHANRWASQIKKNGKKYHLGYFVNAADAYAAYCKAATELFGEYANFN